MDEQRYTETFAENGPTPGKFSPKSRAAALIVAVAVGLAAGTFALVVAVTSNKENAMEAQSEATVVCKQVLKLKQANLDGIDIFEAVVKAGWKEEPPTAAERKNAEDFFDGQRRVFEKVRCP